MISALSDASTTTVPLQSHSIDNVYESIRQTDGSPNLPIDFIFRVIIGPSHYHHGIGGVSYVWDLEDLVKERTLTCHIILRGLNLEPRHLLSRPPDLRADHFQSLNVLPDRTHGPFID